MEYSQLFKTAQKGGYYKQEVNSYIRKMEEDSKTAQEDLQNQINHLTLSRDQLSSEVSNFSERVNQLEEKLSQEKERVREVTVQKDELYSALEQKQQELDDAILARHNDIATCEKEITTFLMEKKELQAKVKQLEEKGAKYDDLHRNLKQYCQKAESDAFCMLETAKEQSMDAISVVDYVTKELEFFQTDVKKLRGDLHIGTEMLEDRLASLYDTLEACVRNLHGIKTRFYAANNLPLEDGYEYVNIAEHAQKTDEKGEETVDEAAEEPDFSGDSLPFPEARFGHEENGMYVPPADALQEEGEAAEEI